MAKKNKVKFFNRYKHNKTRQRTEFATDLASKYMAAVAKTAGEQQQDTEKEKTMSHPVINVNYTSTQTRQVNIGLRLEYSKDLQQSLDRNPNLLEGIEYMANSALYNDDKRMEVEQAIINGAGSRVEIAPDIFLVVPDDDEVNGLCDVEYYENPSEENSGLWELNDIHEVVL